MSTTSVPLERGCCGPDPTVGLDPDAAAAAAALFKALSDRARVRLLSIVAAHPEGEVCACDLTGTVGLSQPTVSHHMSVLSRAGLVGREQRGKWAYFSLAPGARELLTTATGAVLGFGEPARIS